VIITFYSYKGGVGRSMAAANVAKWLRTQGLRVLIVDWDLEAPGIEAYFAKTPEALAALCEAPGVVDLVVSYRDSHRSLFPLQPRVEEASTASKEDPIAKQVSQLRNFLPSLAFALRALDESPPPAKHGSEPGLWLLSAGARAGALFETYARNVHAFDWADLYAHRDGSVFFRWLRDELEAYADVIVIDSRTGVTEMSGVCTRDLADLVVCFSATNNSNLDGVLKMARWFLAPEVPKLRSGRSLSTLVVPSRVDRSVEKDQLVSFKDRFIARVEELRSLDPSINPPLWWSLNIGYYAFYSYQERVVIGQAKELEFLQDDYGRLASHLAQLYLRHATADLTGLATRPLGRELRGILDEAGVDASVHAEAAFANVPPGDQERALGLLTRFVRLSRAEESEALTAVRVATSRLPGTTPDKELIRALVASGLLETDPAEVEVLRLSRSEFPDQWARLRSAIERDRPFLLWRQQLGVSLDGHLAHPDDSGALLSGIALDDALRWTAQRGADLTDDERAFIQSSEAARRTARLATDATHQERGQAIRLLLHEAALESRRSTAIAAALFGAFAVFWLVVLVPTLRRADTAMAAAPELAKLERGYEKAYQRQALMEARNRNPSPEKTRLLEAARRQTGWFEAQKAELSAIPFSHLPFFPSVAPSKAIAIVTGFAVSLILVLVFFIKRSRTVIQLTAAECLWTAGYRAFTSPPAAVSDEVQASLGLVDGSRDTIGALEDPLGRPILGRRDTLSTTAIGTLVVIQWLILLSSWPRLMQSPGSTLAGIVFSVAAVITAARAAVYLRDLTWPARVRERTTRLAETGGDVPPFSITSA
jgi:hypothetical protein